MGLDVPAGTPDRGPGLVAMCIVLMIVSIIATTLRIVSKLVVKQYWWWDDFFAILSLPIQLVLLSLIISWTGFGLGLQAAVVAAVDPLLLEKGAKWLFIAIFFFDTSISFPKLAAIFFYARIFSTTNRIFKISLWAVGCVVSAWLFSAWISTLFQCTPISKAWNPALEGHCIDTYSWYLATAIISSVVDCYILILPVPMIWGLKTSVKRRVYLLGAFFLAYSVIVLSLGRLVSTTQIIPTLALDLTWNLPLYLYWACLEGSVSLISISVPNMIALYKAWVGTRGSKLGSNNNSTKNRTGQASAGYSGVSSVHRSQARGFERLDENSRNASDSDTQGSLKQMDDADEAAIGLGRIHVRTDFGFDTREHHEADRAAIGQGRTQGRAVAGWVN